MHVSSEDQSKLDPKSNQCIFVGYNKGVKGFMLWDPINRKVMVRTDVVFDDQSILKSSDVVVEIETENGNSSMGDKIQVDLNLPNLPSVSPGPLVAQQQVEPISVVEEVQVQGGA